MSRIFTVLIAAVAGGAAVYLFLLRPGDEHAESGDLNRAFARAYGYYVNDTSQDYRRARLELEPFADRLRQSVAYLLDMALIDLAEINQPVQDEDRNLGDPPTYQLLLESALGHLERARAIDPRSDAVAYNLARTYKKLAPQADDDTKLREAATALLEPLASVEPPDPSALFLLGELREEARDYKGALEAYSAIVELGKDYVPETLFIVSNFKRAGIMRRFGDKNEIDRVSAKYKERPRATRQALEAGRYTEFLELGDAPVSAPDPRGMNWRQVTGRSLLPPAGTPRFFLAPDLDNDCRRDMVMNAEGGMRVLRARRSGSYEELTELAGLPLDFALTAAAAGDLDNDGRNDLVVGGPAGLRVFLNTTDAEARTKWSFVDYTNKDRFGPRGAEPVRCIVLWDLDHDGDLDLFVGGEKNRVYRTAIEEPPEGGRFLRFEEMAERLGMLEPAADTALMADPDDDEDVDLVLGSGVWFANLRELRFEKRELPAAGRLGAADVDNDGLEEFRIGREVFKWTASGWKRLFQRRALLDLDGDGVLDEDPFAGITLAGELVSAVGTDLNRDGGRDLLVMTSAGLDVYMSRPDRPAAWTDFMPRGLKTNEFGIGTRLQLRAGDLLIGAICRDGLMSFGLGRRTVVDSVLVRWSNGVEQGVVLPQTTACLEVEEREGEVGSCPFLYAYDGERWHFIADCQSGTPLGLPYKVGAYLPPRSNETILVPGGRLAPSGGVLHLDLAEEFRELFYVDQVVLRAIDHPAGVRPVLNEGFKVFSHPKFHVYGFTDLRPPRAARDHKGRDILDLVSRSDKRHAVVWDKLDGQYVGLAHKWSIELDFGDLSKAERVFLVMDGWVEFPTASASIAASQTKTVAFLPPVVEVVGPDGAWQVADKDAGFPAGKGKSVLVDLTGKFPTPDGRIRVTSTQRLHWDAFLVSTGAEGPIRLTRLPLVSAEHGWRGVGRRVERPGQPWTYSHDDLVKFHAWDQLPAGMLTKYGDVKALLETIDDRYPVLASGDVVRLTFDPAALPDLPEGWVRDFCFTTEGWVKDADMNQAVRERVGPLPFHGMGGYPYDEAEKAHPHPDWVAEWFTRPSRRLVDPEALLR